MVYYFFFPTPSKNYCGSTVKKKYWIYTVKIYTLQVIVKVIKHNGIIIKMIINTDKKEKCN